MVPKKSPRKKRDLKPKIRPSAAEFRAGAEKLDLLNSMAPKRRVPVVMYVSSDSQDETVPSSVTEAKGRRAQGQPTRHGTSHLAKEQTEPTAKTSCRTRADTRSQRRRPIITDSDSDDEADCESPSTPTSSNHNVQGTTVISKRSLPSQFQTEVRQTREATNEGVAKQDFSYKGVVHDNFDLEIDMEGWNDMPTSRTRRNYRSKKVSPDSTRDFGVEASGRQSCYEVRSAYLATDPNTERKTPATRVDAASSDKPSLARPSIATYPTATRAKVKATSIPRYAKQVRVTSKHDKRSDPTCEAVKYIEHEVHHDADTPIPSVEDAYAREKRLIERKRRPY
ncbi:hypothetical protein FB567DRAFT_629931 [Paraphoma chrysanthemicola]|uniref:Uncharacterized protein n=1 Tax=Paraphoma chrysanthemicola TaxID=798071 RepID=A0A8K0VX35_9PLEO|nr:hypothetical protein FB567DRAFT_629931 [Paraphoma chrysanthemicola]